MQGRIGYQPQMTPTGRDIFRIDEVSEPTTGIAPLSISCSDGCPVGRQCDTARANSSAWAVACGVAESYEWLTPAHSYVFSLEGLTIISTKQFLSNSKPMSISSPPHSLQ